ncbi:hypothetical protein [Palleronia caenipelagi]|uniref:Uncharacterized protein n=1 Tax=Palleronia caenipelagi TaxID=2489174 RepID=A0A547PL92_9RHOB|nr:hypothetical protein [Palleronia caenipelagi]TRD14912.1 hypothetical protein FEV53_18135 [Palleronia caenipelagi]
MRQIPFASELRSLMRQRRIRKRYGKRAMHISWTRSVRDMIFMTACFFNAGKVIATLNGSTFGLTNTFNDPMFFVSLLISSLLGNGFFRDVREHKYLRAGLGRKRDISDWRDWPLDENLKQRMDEARQKWMSTQRKD